MTLAQQLAGAAWVPALPLVKTGNWSLAGSPVSGRIRLRKGPGRADAVELAGWLGRVEFDSTGLVLFDAKSEEPVARCLDVRKHLWTITIDGRRFDCTARSPTQLRVTDEAGEEILTIALPRLRRRLPVHVSPHLDDALTLHLVALTSVMTIRLLNRPAAT